MSIPYISASTTPPAFVPAAVNHSGTTIAPSLAAEPASLAPNQQPSAAAIATTIAQTYGFAPSLIVPVTLMPAYKVFNPHPDIVPGVTEIAGVPRTGAYPGQIFDRYA